MALPTAIVRFDHRADRDPWIVLLDGSQTAHATLVDATEFVNSQSHLLCGGPVLANKLEGGVG